MANLIVSAVAEWNGKALKKGAKDVSAFDKGVKKLGKSLAGLFAAQKLAQFAKASVKAFAEDQAAAVKLAKAVDNLGLSYSNPDIANFITKMESQAAILDDKLRPAFQALLTTTGDVAKAQELLTSAIDISRGSGVDLATVSQDLANGYVGITRGLKKYNLGLTQAQLKGKSFEELMVLLNKQFNGSSAAYLDTFAGKMDKINVAFDKVKETIGSGLVQALGDAGGDTGLAGSLKGIIGLATQVSNLLIGIGRTFAVIKPFFDNNTSLLDAVRQYKSATAEFRKEDALAALSDPNRSTLKSSTGTVQDFQRRQKETQAAKAKAAADKKALEIQKTLNKTTAKTAAINKQNAMTDKQRLLFNQTAISAVAALKGKLTDEERNKVELMLALEMDNVDAAALLSQKVAMAYDETGQLAKFLRTLPDAKNPFEAWNTYLNNIAIQANAIARMGASAGSSTVPTPTQPIVPAPTLPKMGEEFKPADFVTLASQGAGASGGFSPVVAAAMAAGGSAGITQNFVTTVNNPVGNGVVDMVQQAILDASRLGHNLVPAGSL
jgi:hypothetical protein